MLKQKALKRSFTKQSFEDFKAMAQRPPVRRERKMLEHPSAAGEDKHRAGRFGM